MSSNPSSKFPSYKERSVADLIPYANNARTHSDEQVAQIAASIKEFGFINPVIVDGENGIVAGHGRLLAARKLGMVAVPTVEVAWLTDAQRKAYIIADNKLALNAGWDTDLLRVELEALQSLRFDVTLTGFSDTELADLLGPEPDSSSTGNGESRGNLSDRFGIPPFTVLNAREGWWQARKATWLALGIQSELGRGGGLTLGDAPQVTESGLNYYRMRERSKTTNG